MWWFIGYVIIGMILFFGVYAGYCYTYKKIRSENRTTRSWSQWHAANAHPLLYLGIPIFWPLSIVFLLIYFGVVYVLNTIKEYIGVEE